MVKVIGVIIYYKQDHKHVDVVVESGTPPKRAKHQVGVDIKTNKGILSKYIADLYAVSRSEIQWPVHIKVETGQNAMSLTL